MVDEWLMNGQLTIMRPKNISSRKLDLTAGLSPS
jgi:hypothetical protein